MIDYSVFMMGNPMDVDAAQKAYAKALSLIHISEPTRH